MHPEEEAKLKAMQAAMGKQGRTQLDDPPREGRPVPRRRHPRAQVPVREDFARREGESRTEAAERFVTIADVHGRPTLDPATSPWDVSRLAGYGDGDEEGNFDSMQGVADMVMGNVDANRELDAPSHHGGDNPMDMAPTESLYQKPEKDVEESWDDDWCAELDGDR